MDHYLELNKSTGITLPPKYRKMFEDRAAPKKPEDVKKPTTDSNFKMPPEDVLETRYKGFAKNQKYLYGTIGQVYYTIGAMMESETISATGSYPGNMFKSMKEAGDFVRPHASAHSRYLKLESNYVETRFSLPEIHIRIGTGYGKPEALDAAEKLIQAYVPGFKMPTEYETVEVPSAYSTPAYPQTEKVRRLKGLDSIEPNLMMLEKITQTKPKYTKKLGWSGPEYPQITTEYSDNKFNKLGYLEFSIDDKASVPLGYMPYSQSEGGKLTDTGARDILIVMKVTGVIRWPLEFALYVTCAAKPSQFIPYLFADYVAEHKKAYAKNIGKRNTVKAPARVNHFGNIKKLIAEEGPRRSIKVNGEGFLILGSSEENYTGRVLWVPQVDLVDDYVNQLRNAYDAKEHEIVLKKSEMLKGVGLFTDPNHEKFSYLNDNGNVETLDLTGSVPLDNMTIRRDLLKKIARNDDAATFFGYLNNALHKEPDLIRNAVEDDPALSKVSYFTNFDQVYKTLSYDSNADVTWGNLGGAPLNELEEEVEPGPLIDNPDNLPAVIMPTRMPRETEFKIEKVLIKLVQQAAAIVLRDFDDLATAYSTKILGLRYQLHLVTTYGKKLKEYNKEYEGRVARNTSKGVDLENPAVSVTNLPNLTFLMPHQLKVQNALSTNPEFAIFDIHVGGGKTGIALVDLARLLSEKKIKKPLIICPNRLVRSWVTEVQNFSKGELNPFAITNDTVRRLKRTLKPGEDPTVPDFEALKNLIDKSPPNTVFITGYSFLSRGAAVDQVLYGHNVVNRYRNAEFFRDYGIDYVAIDESQSVKNLASNQTIATATVMTGATYRRLMSGTIVNNTAADLVGQMSMLNPAVFGKKSEFEEKYTKEGSGSSKLMKRGAASEIVKEMMAHTLRFTAKKREWAFTLPKLESKFYEVRLTENQQNFYNEQVEQTLANIMNDPKLRRALEDADPEKAEAIAEKLKIYFARVEEFLCSPESNDAFAALSTTEEEDLISPKVGAVEKLLNRHFNINKDPFKVIVFAYRVVTPEHVYKYLSPEWQKQAVLFTSKTGMAPIDEFMKNDKVKILIANESSINKGFNLQMASRMIRLETLWAPGDQEQAIGRIFRPSIDPKTGKPKFAREKIFMDYLFTEGTLEVAKIARMVSKQIDKAKYDEDDNPNFQKIRDKLDELDLIKMSLKTIQEFSHSSDINDYMANYAILENWEEGEFDRLRESGIGMVAVDDASRRKIEGSKTLKYIPRVDGVDPLDLRNESLAPISVVESEANAAANGDNDDEDEEENLVEVNPVVVSQLVDTEFGPGFVLKIKKNDVDVRVPGIPNPVTVSKATCWVWKDPDAENRVRVALKKAGAAGLPRLPGTVIDEAEADNKKTEIEKKKTPGPKTQQDKIEKDITTPKIKPNTTRDKLGKNRDVTDDDKALELMPDIIDGGLVLTAYAEDSDTDALIERGWRYLPEHITVWAKTVQGLNNLFTTLEKKGYTIPEQNKQYFKIFSDRLKTNSLGKLGPKDYAEAGRYLKLLTHKKPKNPKELRPYPMVAFDDVKNIHKLYVCFTAETQPEVLKLLNIPKIDGLGGFIKDGPFIMLLNKTKADALAEIKALSSEMKIKDMKQLISDINQIKAK